MHSNLVSTSGGSPRATFQGPGLHTATLLHSDIRNIPGNETNFCRFVGTAIGERNVPDGRTLTMQNCRLASSSPVCTTRSGTLDVLWTDQMRRETSMSIL